MMRKPKGVYLKKVRNHGSEPIPEPPEPPSPPIPVPPVADFDMPEKEVQEVELR